MGLGVELGVRLWVGVRIGVMGGWVSGCGWGLSAKVLSSGFSTTFLMC